MASVDVPVALLGYGTVGAAVNRLLVEGAEEIERATGHRLRVTRALVRDPDKERDYPVADGVLTTDFRSVLEDDSIALVAEVMGGVDPTGGYVDEFDLAGRFVAHVARMGELNAPWGLAQAPRSFGRFGGDLLVGNFGDGRIKAFNLSTSSFDGALTQLNGAHPTRVAQFSWAIGCSLAEGKLSGTTVECPCHGSRYDLRDGSVIQGPASEPELSFDVRKHAGQVEVRLSPGSGR